MSTASQGDMQFNCRLCDFVGNSKTEIAEHFLTEHIEEYVSLSKAATSTTTTSEEETKEQEQEKATAEEEDSEAGKSDGKEAHSTEEAKKSKTLDEILQSKLEKEVDPKLGRGMRRRKKTIPKHIMKFHMDDDEDDNFDEEDDAWTPVQPPKITVKPLSKLAKSGGKSRKKGKRPRGRPSTKSWKDGTPVGEKRKQNKPEENLPISVSLFNRVVDEKVREWFTAFKAKRMTETFRCPDDRCGNEMNKVEMEIHQQCHVPNLEGFRCPICEFLCLNWAKMRVHYRTSHEPSLNVAKCDFDGCSKTFPCIGTRALQAHALSKHIRPQLLEQVSRKEFDPAELSHYIKDDADGVKDGGADVAGSNEEDQAGNTTSQEGRKRRAEKGVAGEPPLKKGGGSKRKFQRYIAHICNVCFARFKDEEKMKLHKAAHYDEEDKELIHCTECEDFSTKEEDAIREHLGMEHKRMLHLHRCDICNFSTNHFHDLKKHLVTHTGIKNYMCDKCGKRTTTPFNLRIHYRRIHATEEEKKLKCMSCDYRCADKGILKEHIKHKHGLLIKRDEYDKPRSVPNYPCTLCDYVGRKQKSLDYHMRIHTENRQFKCHLCPYASKTKNNLVLHVRTHEGLQPNKCPHCEFRGATNKIISEHIMSKHAKVRPYRCNICNWTAAYNGNMWKHIETHQKELGDKMPEYPVSVLSQAEALAMPTALRAPSGKKRGHGRPLSPSSPSSKPKVKKNRPKYEEPPSGVILATRNQVQEVQVISDGGVITSEGMVMQMINVQPAHDTNPVIKVSGENEIRHHQMIEYSSVPPVTVTQQIIAGGDMAQVISEQQYQHHHPQHDPRNSKEIHPIEVHAVAMHPGQDNVPAPAVEQIVRDTDHSVHHLVAAMMPRW